MSNNYIEQCFTVNINVKPEYINKNIKMYIEKLIDEQYTGKRFLNSYIKSGTIKVTSIGRGIKNGCNLHGWPTFPVAFKADCLVYNIGDTIMCIVSSIMPDVIICKTSTIKNIFIVEYMQNIEDIKFAGINLNDIVLVRIDEYIVHSCELSIKGVVIDKPNVRISPSINFGSYDILWGNFISNDYISTAAKYMNEQIIECEKQIDPYDIKGAGNNRSIWEEYIVKCFREDFYKVTVNKPSYAISRAHFKMMEMLTQHNIINYKNPINIACIAEAPGGFYSAILRYREKYIAIHADAEQQKLSKQTDTYNLISYINKLDKSSIQWSPMITNATIHTYIATNDPNICGDLTNLNVINEFAKRCPKDGCHLVTADGAIDGDHENKEIKNGKLFLGEILTAFKILTKGGSFILKIYTVFTTLTVNYIIILSKYFNNVYIHKPYTSNDSNTERYLICIGFNGISIDELTMYTEMFEKYNNTDLIPEIIIKYKNDALDSQIYDTMLTIINEYNNKTTIIQLAKINDMISICEEFKKSSNTKKTFEEIKVRRNWEKTLEENIKMATDIFLL
jgi:23S rRNA U2552 (ribose-2'-O)-methylase RlmE/FtsJ